MVDADKRVLMVAFHFPPAAGSSGIQRTLRFVQHLPKLGWQPTVLSATIGAYERTSDDLVAEVPASVGVHRGLALDTSRHLAVAGRYPGFLARPDRWSTWYVGGVYAGLKALRQGHFDLIWSTFPIATAHRIAATLQRHSGLPWVADFRDPMAQDGYPEDPKTWHSYKRVEEVTLARAARSVFTTPGAVDHYRALYGRAVSAERIVLIENGYDEASFASCGDDWVRTPLIPGKRVLLHSGIVYPSERDPTQLIDALALLQGQGAISATNFCFRFRASEHDGLIGQLAHARGVRELIELVPPIPYRDALGEMLCAEALVIMQASNCNAQVPAKLYEYLRAGRPILALTDPLGDAARVLGQAGIGETVRLDNAPEIARFIKRFLDVDADDRSATVRWIGSDDAVAGASREARAEKLATLFDEALNEWSSAHSAVAADVRRAA